MYAAVDLDAGSSAETGLHFAEYGQEDQESNTKCLKRKEVSN